MDQVSEIFTLAALMGVYTLLAFGFGAIIYRVFEGEWP